MEERRQRIMRRYLRERSNIVQSDLEVPVPRSEDEILADSEKYKESQVNLQRQEGGSPMPPPPPPRRPPPPVENRNWLLAVDPLVADPFAPADAEEDSKKKTDWTAWGNEKEPSPYGTAKYESWFSRKSKEASVEGVDRYGSRQQGSPASYNPFSSGGYSFGRQQKETVPGGYSSLFGPKQEGSSGFGGLDLSRERESNPNQNPLQSPFLRVPTPSASGSGSESKGQGYIPYKTYETRRQQQQQQQQWGGQKQQEFKRVDPYQKWKKSTPVYDPTGNDAFINEHMPKSKR